MSSPAAGRRALAATVVLLVAAALALAAAATLAWARQVFAVPLRGAVPVTADGAAVAPVLGPLALLALAAVAAALGSAGWARRLLGVLLLAAAAAPALAVIGVVTGRVDLAAAAGRAADLVARSQPHGPVTLLVAGPLVAAVGALLLAVAGLLLAVRGHRMPQLGSRYATPAQARRDAPDPQRALWDRLDAGSDPTDPAR